VTWVVGVFLSRLERKALKVRGGRWWSGFGGWQVGYDFSRFAGPAKYVEMAGVGLRGMVWCYSFFVLVFCG